MRTRVAGIAGQGNQLLEVPAGQLRTAGLRKVLGWQQRRCPSTRNGTHGLRSMSGEKVPVPMGISGCIVKGHGAYGQCSSQTVNPDKLHIPYPPRKELPRLDVGVVPCRMDSWRPKQEEAFCNDFYDFLEVNPDFGEGRGGESPLPHREDVPLEGLKLPYRCSEDTTTTKYEFLGEDGVTSLYAKGLLCSCGDRSTVQTPRNTRSGRVYGYC
uniref:Uncharacterized protein n=1 Tax=Timema bartmani TaxID=61472 RepID=A0A7R9F6C2_9NEOP|nr:unnamed protein product [Timema bartmani]